MSEVAVSKLQTKSGNLDAIFIVRRKKREEKKWFWC